MKTIRKGVLEHPCLDAVYHAALLPKILGELRRYADYRGLLDSSPAITQRVCGAIGIKKEDYKKTLALASLYGLIKINLRTKEVRLL